MYNLNDNFINVLVNKSEIKQNLFQYFFPHNIILSEQMLKIKSRSNNL